MLTDPKLEAAVSDYLTSDFRVLPGSPAIAAGSTVYTRLSDYAGSPIMLSGPPTMGAFEMQANEASFARSARNGVRSAFSEEAIEKNHQSPPKAR